MTAFLIVLAVAAEAYLLGSVDTGILVSKYLYHDDVRTHGSGAAGMTNMLRTFGKKAAALTAVGDVLKGVVAVCLGRWLFGHLPADAASRPIWASTSPPSSPWWATPSPSTSASRAARACWWLPVPFWQSSRCCCRCWRSSSSSAWSPPAWCRWAASPWPRPTRS